MAPRRESGATSILNLYDPCCFYGSNYAYWVDEVKAKVQQLGR